MFICKQHIPVGTELVVVVGEVGRDELEGSGNEKREEKGNNKIIVC